MAGDQRCDELVAQLGRAHRRAVLVFGAQQHREHVWAVRVFASTLVDQLEDQPVGLLAEPFQATHRSAAGQGTLRERQQRDRVLGELEHLREQFAQAVELGALLQPEDCSQHDLQRQLLQARVQCDRLVLWPSGDLALGQLAHQLGQGLHRVAVEGGQHQLALAQVWLLVEQDHRVWADDRLEDARALARVQHLRGRLEDFLDLIGV